MALKAKVPIIVASLDYKVKEMGIKGVIYDVEDYHSVINQIHSFYTDVSGKRPDQFVLQTEEEYPGIKNILNINYFKQTRFTNEQISRVYFKI